MPKLRGFKNRFKIAYEVVNVGRISDYVDQGRFAEAEEAMLAVGLSVEGPKGAPLTVNAELLRAVGLIGTLRQPVKVLGGGEVSRRLFIVADAFTKSAREKIEAAGGTAQVIEFPSEPLAALTLEAAEAAAQAEADAQADAAPSSEETADSAPAETPARRSRRRAAPETAE